jgi:hypothetical protein
MGSAWHTVAKTALIVPIPMPHPFSTAHASQGTEKINVIDFVARFIAYAVSFFGALLLSVVAVAC